VSCDDGVVSLLLSSSDGAGNRNASGVVVSWSVDTSPPNTSAALNAATTWHVWQPALATYVVNSSSLQLSLSALEVVASFAVMVDDRAVSVSSNGVVSEVLDGRHTLSVSAVDLAGNVDPTPVVLPVYVDTTPWSTLRCVGLFPCLFLVCLFPVIEYRIDSARDCVHALLVAVGVRAPGLRRHLSH
jgi:hypothetical protein